MRTAPGDIGETRAAERIHGALHKIYQEGRWLTADVGGKATTTEFTKAVIGAMT